MPTFAFTARDASGKTVRGQRRLESEGALALALEAEGLLLIRARPAALAAPDPRKAKRKVKLDAQDLSTFLLHLAAYQEVGLPLLDALRDYREPGRPALEAAVLDMSLRLSGGASLSAVMAAYPGLFQPVHVSMIQAGEAVGRLDQALRAVIRLVEWEAGFRAQIRQASTYPLILLGLLGLIGVLVSTFSLPPILNLLEGFQIPLPLVTRIFLGIGHGLASYGWLLLALPLALRFGFAYALRHPPLRFAWDQALLELPGAGPLVIRLGLARFAHFLGAQYGAGIPVVQALRQSETVTGNACLEQGIRRMREGVEQGEKLSVMAARIKHFPQMVIRMLATGEETGKLDETLEKAAAHFDAEVARRVTLLFQLLDPILKVVLACLLVFVACAILLPLYLLIAGING